MATLPTSFTLPFTPLTPLAPPQRMVKGQLPFSFIAKHGSRIGLLRKDAKDASGMRWFKVRVRLYRSDKSCSSRSTARCKWAAALSRWLRLGVRRYWSLKRWPAARCACMCRVKVRAGSDALVYRRGLYVGLF